MTQDQIYKCNWTDISWKTSPVWIRPNYVLAKGTFKCPSSTYFYNVVTESLTENVNENAYRQLPEKALVRFFHYKEDLYYFRTNGVTDDYVYR